MTMRLSWSRQVMAVLGSFTAGEIVFKATLIAWLMCWMKKISQPTQRSASIIAPTVEAIGANGCGRLQAAGNAPRQ